MSTAIPSPPPEPETAPPSLDERFAALQAQMDKMSVQLSGAMHVGEPWDWDHTDDAKLTIPPEWAAHIFQGAEAPVQLPEAHLALISALVRRISYTENQRRVDRRKIEELEKEQSWYVQHRQALECRLKEVQKFMALPTLEAGQLAGMRPMTTVEAERLKVGLEALTNGDKKLEAVRDIIGRSATEDGVVEVDIEKATIDQRWRLYFLVTGFKIKRSLPKPSGSRKQAKSPTPRSVSVASFGGGSSFADSALVHDTAPFVGGDGDGDGEGDGELDEFSFGGF